MNIGKGEQFKAEFLAVSPNNHIPAVVDQTPAGGGNPIAVFESGAMLLYLAEKTGKFMSVELAPAPKPSNGCSGKWQSRADGRSEQSFRRLRGGENTIRHGPLPQRGEPALRRARPAAGGSSLRRRRLFDRGHGDLSLDRAVRTPGTEIEDFPHLKSWFDTIGARRRSCASRKGESGQSELGGIRRRKSVRSCSARPRPRSNARPPARGNGIRHARD